MQILYCQDFILFILYEVIVDKKGGAIVIRMDSTYIQHIQINIFTVDSLKFELSGVLKIRSNHREFE